MKFLLLSVLMSLCFIIPSAKYTDEFREKKIRISEIELFQEETGLSFYSARACVSVLHENGCDKIKEISIISDNKGYTVKITDHNENIFFAGIGELGLMDVIRKDSEDGEPVYYSIE